MIILGLNMSEETNTCGYYWCVDVCCWYRYIKVEFVVFCLPKRICLLSQKTYEPNRQGCNTQHTTRLWGPGIHSEREEQQPVPEYRIDYDAPRVAHRSCSALRRLPARARPDLLASSVRRRLAHRSDWQ